MSSVISVTLCTTALFMAIVLNLAARPKISKRIISIAMALTAVGGLLIYGYGYGYGCEPGEALLAVIKANFAVCKMFVGANAYGDVSGAPLFAHLWAQLLFWLLHLMGLFSAAGAAVTALGSGLLRQIRMWLYRSRELAVIYGLREDTLAFGRLLQQDRKISLLYVAEAPEAGLAKAVDQMGCLIRSDEDACRGSVRFLRGLGLRPGSRRIWVYGLHPDEVKNRRYAGNILRSMEQLEIRTEQTLLTVLGPEDETDNLYQARPGRYGYGTVISVNEPELVARTLIRACPPFETIRFDACGRAENDFHGLIIGAGQVGQAVLRQFVMNGQFCGSQFHLGVFAPDYRQMMGRLTMECAAMMERYDIQCFGDDGRSAMLYRYLQEHMDTLCCIAVCTGSDAMNSEIAEQLRAFLARRGCQAPIYRCSHGGVCVRVDDDRIKTYPIYTPELLCSDRIDRTAMVLNQSYCGSGTAEENWAACDYFSRMSSRASADFAPAFLRAAGHDPKTVPDTWSPTGQLLENLAETEHMRWNAFHFAMGFAPMSREEFDDRAAAYREEVARSGKSAIRIGKNLDGRTHACLVDWDELDELACREAAITGRQVNYKEMDRNNVRAVADVLRAAEERQ